MKKNNLVKKVKGFGLFYLIPNLDFNFKKSNAIL